MCHTLGIDWINVFWKANQHSDELYHCAPGVVDTKVNTPRKPIHIDELCYTAIGWLTLRSTLSLISVSVTAATEVNLVAFHAKLSLRSISPVSSHRSSSRCQYAHWADNWMVPGQLAVLLRFISNHIYIYIYIYMYIYV